MSFSFSIKKASSAAKLAAAAAVSAKSAATRAPLSVFKEALEAEEESEKQQAFRPTLSAFAAKSDKKQKEKISNLLKEDPKALAYDEVYDQVSSNTAKEQQRRAQSRRLYLGYTEDIKEKIEKDGATADALATDAGPSKCPQGSEGAQPRFISKLLVQAQRRQIEREIIKERQLQKDREREGETETEVFVTSAYKARLEERKKIQLELERQEAIDAARAADKQKDLTSFHAYLLKSGAATRSATAATPPTHPPTSSPFAACATVKTETPVAGALKNESRASPQPPQQQQKQEQKQMEEVKEELPESSCRNSCSGSSSSSKSPIDAEAVLPFKRSAEPKTLPVPDKLSSKELADARSRYLQRKRLKMKGE